MHQGDACTVCGKAWALCRHDQGQPRPPAWEWEAALLKAREGAFSFDRPPLDYLEAKAAWYAESERLARARAALDEVGCIYSGVARMLCDEGKPGACAVCKEKRERASREGAT